MLIFGALIVEDWWNTSFTTAPQLSNVLNWMCSGFSVWYLSRHIHADAIVQWLKPCQCDPVQSFFTLLYREYIYTLLSSMVTTAYILSRFRIPIAHVNNYVKCSNKDRNLAILYMQLFSKSAEKWLSVHDIINIHNGFSTIWQTTVDKFISIPSYKIAQWYCASLH